MIQEIHRKHPGLVYKIAFLFAFIAAFTFLALKMPKNSEAASLANFKPGNIISDYTMSNYTTMTVAEIDAFLHAHGNCNDTNTVKASWYPNLHYHIKDGHFVCLADEVFSDGIAYGDLIPEGTKTRTAAQIIYDVAQEWKINPQVLLVLLEKEQGLISDSWPNSIQYRSATGFGCPDTAPCNEVYYGFYNQLDNAAYLFRTVLNGGWTNYPLGENYIKYNPDASCGGSVVNIENLATSSLYRYTPYQPNAGALAAGYGTTYCGAYGNRNFYLFFMDWFGDPTVTIEPVTPAETKFEQPIEDGTYQIFSVSAPEKVFDIRGGIKAGMTLAEMLAFSRNAGTTDNQVFDIKYNKSTGYYNLINPASGLYLDVRGGKTENGTTLIVFPKNGSCNQDWLIETDSDGNLTFISRCSSKALENSNGTLVINKNYSSTNQKWTLTRLQSSDSRVEDGVYQIAHGENAFDISGGVSVTTKSGAVIIYPKNFQTNQLFEITYDASVRNYTLKNPTSGLLLTSGANLTVSSTKNDCSQRWLFEKADNAFRLLSACDGSSVVISSSKKGSFNLVSTSVSNSNTFTLEKYIPETPETPASSQLTLENDKLYQLRSADQLTSLDISGGVIPNMQIGTLISFPARTANIANQTFAFKYVKEKDAYYIYNPTSGLRLDVARSGKTDGSEVIVFKDNGGYCNQLWKVKSVGEGIKIFSSCSDKPLTISDIKIGSGNKLVVSTEKDSEAEKQTWKLIAL